VFFLLKISVQLYNWWKNKKMSSISGILTVTLESQSRLLLNLEPTLRSFFPIQSEISLKNSSYIVNESNNLQNVENRGKIQNKKLVKNDRILLWDRIEGQSCKIPKTRWHSLIGSGRGCFCLKFSNDGRQMSCASPINSSNEYSIFIYEIPSTDLLSHFGHHNGIIYELDWSHDNRKLLSASNDCTARVWKLNDSYECIGSVLLPHPSFLYSAKFHIKNSDIVLTAGFDGIVRVWSINESNQIELIQELNPCKGSVLCLSWNFTNNDEFQIFSGSNDGIIRVMSQNETEWGISKTIALKDLKNISINSISVHPNGNKLIIFCRDGIHRMMDYKL
jgi:jouberin